MAEAAGGRGGDSDWFAKNKDQIVPWAILGALMCVLIYVYLNSLLVASKYWENPKYSHGWLVPLFTAVLLWLRHEPFGPVTIGARCAGVGLLCLGLGIRLATTWSPNVVPEMDSFV